MTDQASSVLPQVNSRESALKCLSTKEIKKLTNFARGVRALAFFWLLAIAMCVVFIASPQSTPSGSLAAIVYPTIAVLAAIAAIGTWLYKSWGRILSMAMCIVLILVFPIWALIGIPGLFALWGSKRLFGTDRITQAELKAELDHRKLDNVV